MRIYSWALLICSLLTSSCATNEAISQTRLHYVEPKNWEDWRNTGREVPGNPAYYALLPFTIAFDIATSPIQFAMLMTIGIGAKAPKLPKAPHVDRRPAPPRKGLCR
jgi:hypothetical protein